MNKPTNCELEQVLKYYADLCMFDGYTISSPDSRGPADDTPFHMAAYDGDVKVIQVMLPYLDDINLRGDNGYTPLHYAISTRQLAAVEALIANSACLYQTNDYGDTAIDLMQDEPCFAALVVRLMQAHKEG